MGVTWTRGGQPQAPAFGRHHCLDLLQNVVLSLLVDRSASLIFVYHSRAITSHVRYLQHAKPYHMTFSSISLGVQLRLC